MSFKDLDTDSLLRTSNIFNAALIVVIAAGMFFSPEIQDTFSINVSQFKIRQNKNSVTMGFFDFFSCAQY